MGTSIIITLFYRLFLVFIIREKNVFFKFFPDDLKFQIGEGVDKRARNFHPVIEGGVEGKKPLELLNNGNGSSSSNNVWNNKKKLHA
jgi:hypothetical protein